MAPSLRHDIIEANFYGCETADSYDSDVLDLHYHFRLSLQHRMPDGIHWGALAHRRISGLLLHHIADAWGVDLHDPTSIHGEGQCTKTVVLLLKWELTLQRSFVLNGACQTSERLILYSDSRVTLLNNWTSDKIFWLIRVYSDRMHFKNVQIRQNVATLLSHPD